MADQPHHQAPDRAGQLRGSDWDYATGVVERASPDIKAVLDNQQPDPTLTGQLRAVIDHNEQRQREAEQEAENQRIGDYSSVFLKPDRQQVDIGFY